ncbi:MAG: tetratricopeptide repeat protein [Candidatus Omnitrophica bacterium]|nr:tetratricopeptide repeat protein [Candidatus Omnitrophota bacterium]MCM8802176.1 tetratricopeptide repeat protein [Candidatus Omnitrophota bacterium]
MLKKQIFLYLLLILFGIGETEKNYLKLAITSSQNGFYELSNKYLEQYIASGEQDYIDYVYLLYGYNLIKLEKYEQATEKFAIIIKEFPLSQYQKNAYLFLFPIYLKTDRIDSAINLYKEYKEKFNIDENIEKNIGEKILQKGIELFKNKNIPEAKIYFSLIINEIQQKDLILWANYYIGLCEYQDSNFSKAKYYFEKVIISEKREIVSDSKLKLGDCYFNLRDYEQAEKYYNELLKENSIFSQWAKFQIAMIEKRKGEIEKSLETLENIDFEDDLNLMFKVLDEKANIYMLLERWEEAENILNSIINKFSSKKEISEIYFKLGIINFNKKEFDKSILFFKKSIELSYEDLIKEKSLFFLGYVNYLKKDFNASFRVWQDLIEKYPESSFISQIYFLKGKNFYNENNHKYAERFFKEVIKRDNPYKEQALTYLIEILINENKLSEGENYAKEFLEKKYDNYINFLLGKIYYLKGEYEKAKEIFENLKIDNPILKVETNFYLGKIYQKKGDTEKAKEKFIEIISLYPQYKEWKEKAEKSLKELKK